MFFGKRLAIYYDLPFQTWPTEAEMAEADRNQKQKRLKKRILPRGTSEYQVCACLYRFPKPPCSMYLVL